MTDGRAFARRLVLAAILAGAAAAALFLVFPQIDLVASGLLAADGFALGASEPVRAVRTAFNLLFIAGCVTAVVGILAALVRRKALFGLPAAAWACFGACLAIGPGVVANLILKGHWGRARPIQSEPFGGELTFTPPLMLSDQCQANCSFVAGEASSIYMLFFALALILPRHRGRVMAAGLVLGSLAGLTRMAAGGHFLSDVIFAGVFMAATAGLLYLAVPWGVVRSGPAAAEPAQVHVRHRNPESRP